jgi:exosortase B
MSFVLRDNATHQHGSNPWLHWIPIAVGLAALYVPTYIRLGTGVWHTDDQGHGPLILAVIFWLAWQKRSVLVVGEVRPSRTFGWLILGFGLLLYILGRSQDILLLEVGSHIPVLAGAILVTSGKSALRALAFPIAFFVFMVPLPSVLVDTMTGPMKQSISEIAEELLYSLGYPIARSGVTLTIGPYQLLVADACSGLHSLYSLSALGLLYLYLKQHQSVLHNILLGAAILPIAFSANVIRVILLVLITYHFGDDAGQGFLHGFTGLVLFIAGLLLLVAVDAAVNVCLTSRIRGGGKP